MPEQLIAGFAARQASPAYQEMLVHIIFSPYYLYALILQQHQRNSLPIAQYRDEIISSLAQSQILVLSGETGW